MKKSELTQHVTTMTFDELCAHLDRVAAGTGAYLSEVISDCWKVTCSMVRSELPTKKWNKVKEGKIVCYPYVDLGEFAIRTSHDGMIYGLDVSIATGKLKVRAVVDVDDYVGTID